MIPSTKIEYFEKEAALINIHSLPGGTIVTYPMSNGEDNLNRQLIKHDSAYALRNSGG